MPCRWVLGLSAGGRGPRPTHACLSSCSVGLRDSSAMSCPYDLSAFEIVESHPRNHDADTEKNVLPPF